MDIEKDLELLFIGGKFLQNQSIPKDKKYLLKHFKRKTQKKFVLYYLIFGQYKQFTEHTGYPIKMRWLTYMKNRIDYLIREHDLAKKSIDIEKVANIETGNFEYQLKMKKQI